MKARPKSKARACRSKYLGTELKLRGRRATVMGCARPKAREAPKKPVSRFRVEYPSGNVRPVPRSTVYRAARCSAKPAARGCAPLDIERAPWLANRPEDTSFDFGEFAAEPPPAPAPRASRPPTRRVPELAGPARPRRRVPEAQGPVRLPSPALLSALRPETRELARWLAYAAPWAWNGLAERVAYERGLIAQTGRPMPRSEFWRRYGYDYTRSRGYGSERVANNPPHSLISDSIMAASIAAPPFRPRRSTEHFILEVQNVVDAILSLESGVWSGVFVPAKEGGLTLRAQPDPAATPIPPGTHGSTAAAMRRRVAGRVEVERRAWRRLGVLIPKAEEVVARWSSGAIPSALYALERSTYGGNSPNEYAETWQHAGRDWRVQVGRDTSIAVDRFEDGQWRPAWSGRYDLRHDRIDLVGAPKSVTAALAASPQADWAFKRLFGGGRESRRASSLRDYDAGRAARGGSDCAASQRLYVEGGEAWSLTRRIPCANEKGAEALRRARDAELRVLCEEPLSDGCEAFHELVDAGCAPACEAGKGDDRGECPYQINKAQMEAWQNGSEPIPPHVYDTDRPHVVGSDHCYFGPAMTARRRLHAKVRRDPVPAAVSARGPGAIENYILDRVRQAEDAWPDRSMAELWRRDDERILGRARAMTTAHHQFGVNDVDDLSLAYLGALEGDYSAAFKIAGTYHVTDATGDIDQSGIADELWRYWVEEQGTSPGGKGRVTAMRRRYSVDGKLLLAKAALAIANGRVKGKKAKQWVR